MYIYVRTVRKRIYLGVGTAVAFDSAQARKGVLPVDVHGARTADTFTARATEGEGRIHFVLDFDKGIEDLKTPN